MKVRFFLDGYKDRAGMQKIMCEYSHGRPPARIKTGLKVKSRLWNQKAQEIRAGHEMAVTLNKEVLKPMKDKLISIAHTLIAKGREPIPSRVKAIYKDGQQSSAFWDCYRKFIENHVSGKSQKTKNAYEYMRKSLAEYEASRPNPVTFEAVNLEFFEGWKSHQVKGGAKTNTIALRCATFIAFMRFAHKSEWHSNARYQFFAYSVEKTKQVALSGSELKAISELDLSEKLERVRAVFIFQIHSGLRVGDLFSIVDINTGEGLLSIWMKKGGKPHQINLSTTAAQILKKYKGALPIDFVQKTYISRLREICQMAGIDAPVMYRGKYVPKFQAVATHTARRTTATLMHKAGRSIKEISLFLGHSSVTTTERYIKSTAMDVRPLD